MGRKRRQVVVTVTETWTFVFDAAGEAPSPASPRDPPALASIPAPSVDDLRPSADAPDALAADAQGIISTAGGGL